MNKKRQELSEQLRQISFKIDQEISELRKQNPVSSNNNNNSASSSLAKKREPVGTTANYEGISSSSGTRTKTQESSMVKSVHHPQKEPLTNSRDIMNSSRDGGMSSRAETGTSSRVRDHRAPPPKSHYGPFNTQCIFMEQPKSLL